MSAPLVAALAGAVLAACGGGDAEESGIVASAYASTTEAAGTATGAALKSALAARPAVTLDTRAPTATLNAERTLPSLAAAVDGTASAIAPSSWYLNAWGSVPAVVDARTASGMAECTRNGVAGFLFRLHKPGNGAAELVLPHALQPGSAYEFRAWIRAVQPASAVDVFFRRAGAPYETTAIKTLTPSADWQEVVVRGVHAASTIGVVRLALRSAGSAVCIHGGTLRQITAAEVGKPDGPTSVPDRFFGVHLNKLGRHMRWPEFNPGLVRLWDSGTTWADLQPTPQPIDWAHSAHAQRLDLYVRHKAQHNPNAGILYTLGMTPAWATTAVGDVCHNQSYGPAVCKMPARLDTWRAYVRALATRFKGQIQYWELWNEADIGQHWDESPQAMVELAKAAYQELKAIDRNNQLIGPNITGLGLRFLNDFLVAGGGQWVDALSVHAYAGRTPEPSFALLRNVRELQGNLGLKLPVWNTETAVACNVIYESCDPGKPPATPPQTADDVALARAVLGNAALGAASFTFYTWEGAFQAQGVEGLVRADFSTTTPSGQAFDRVKKWMTGATVEYATGFDSALVAVRISKAGKTAYALWSQAGATTVNLSAWPTMAAHQTLRQPEGARPLRGVALRVGDEPVLIFEQGFAFDGRP